MTNICHFFVGLVFLILSGCSSYGVIDNKIKSTTDDESGYSWHSWSKGEHNDDLSIMLTFSGGGTRAAAVAYGVLRGLRDTTIPVKGKSVRMLDEVDFISSVSGGSFTAAYYGLHGDGIFETYEKAFLLSDVEKYLFWGVANPIEWFRQGGRTEMAIKYYNDTIFHDATFADINSKSGPLIIINASGLAHGVRFSFLQEYFNLLCSDIDSFPVAKAVAASSAVPIVFLPVVLEKYTVCGSDEPEWLKMAKNKTDGDPLLAETTDGIDKLLNKDQLRYIHLVDGGITDNLGLHALYDMVSLTGGVKKTLKTMNKKPPSHLVVIAVNSSTEPQPDMDLSNKEPSIGETISAISGTQLHRYNTMTMELMKSSVKKWAEEVSTQGHQVDPYFIRIGLSNIRESELKLFFNKIPTSFSLSKEVVDRLVNGGYKLLHNDPEYQRLISDLKGNIGTQ